ncbi:hypothetical protein B0H19DRAFT_299429 [Mycena capillaripes]|nr:hypothetical protein B0H19DRAFT_299429 [Mycena capillaripes]
MNRSVNVQRSSSSQSPVTPPRRTARLPLSPKHNHDNLRRHHIPRRDAVTPQAPSLAHANARLIHERLQQNHDRLQVQLHARPPANSSLPAGPVKAFLDTTFRAYASRIQTEFTSLRAACARAVQREQHQAAQMRSTCARLARERDVAEEKLRVLLDRRKRSHSEVEKEDADAETTGLLYPPSPVSPLQLPTQSPPPRLMSPFVLAVRRSPSHTPDPEDRTGFDLTVSCDTLPRPMKKRRVSASPERASTARPDGDAVVTTERETCPPAGFGECDMDLESGSESDSSSDSEADTSSFSSGSKPRSSSRAASSSLSVVTEIAKPSLEQRPTPPPSASPAPAPTPARAHLPLEYVDIMYLPTDGKLVCRVCLLAATSNISSSKTGTGGPIKAFLPGASWDMLRTHSEEAHPDACRDVVGLGLAGVRELRRRLGLGNVALS